MTHTEWGEKTCVGCHRRIVHEKRGALVAWRDVEHRWTCPNGSTNAGNPHRP